MERPYQGPAPGPREVRAPHRPGEGGGRGRCESASAHTHKGHAGRTRRATGPSPRKPQTAWNGVPASEEKGHPDGTARHTQRRKRGAGRGKRGRHNTRHRPESPQTVRERHAPAPRLRSLRASPWGSHCRQARSTGPAAPAPRATTQKGGDALGKRLQPQLLSDALTGEWRNGEAGERRGSEPCEPGGLRHQAIGAS